MTDDEYLKHIANIEQSAYRAGLQRAVEIANIFIDELSLYPIDEWPPYIRNEPLRSVISVLKSELAKEPVEGAKNE
jgi:hypothetical protein